ncbi:hypothetical protein D3C86_1852810 [compost metagenome]
MAHARFGMGHVAEAPHRMGGRGHFEHAAAGVEKGQFAARRGAAQGQAQAQEAAIEIDGAIHVADRHADMFEAEQHRANPAPTCRRRR